MIKNKSTISYEELSTDYTKSFLEKHVKRLILLLGEQLFLTYPLEQSLAYSSTQTIEEKNGGGETSQPKPIDKIGGVETPPKPANKTALVSEIKKSDSITRQQSRF